MAPFHDKEALESMKRADLQKLCKDYGVKANLKTEAIIDLLLDAQKPSNRGSATPALSEQPARRTVSTRLSSRSATTGRTSSMIIHDIDEEEEIQGDAGQQQEDQQHDDKLEPEIPHAPSRTRKAKDTQTRLGVGRPVAAGGKGARAVTKSINVSRSKRSKGSRSVKPSEATIPEEDTEQVVETDAGTFPDAASPSAEKDETPKLLSSNITANSSSHATPEVDIEQRVADAVQPLYQQLKALKSEFEQIQSLKSEMVKLQTQVAEMEIWKHTVDNLTAEVRDLRQKAVDAESLTAEIQQLKEIISNRSDSPAAGYRTPTMTSARIPNALSTPRATISTDDAQPSGPTQKLHPGIAPVLLGKRHRDSTSSNVTGVVEENQESLLSEAELAKKVIRPNKKRARLTPGVEDPHVEHEPVRADEADQPSEEAEQSNEASRAPSFAVYRGPEVTSPYDDPPPPTTPLPSFYRSLSPSNNDAGPSRPRQNAVENQHPFSFSFVPIPPTPGAGSIYSVPNFPYPEPPQSPTPVGNHPPLIGSSRDRTDIFQSFGLPPPGRPRSRLSGGSRGQDAAGEMGAFINPAALETRAPSTDADDSFTKEPATGARSTVKRTMYGTELESDTRFGDFGLEGVASGFWTGQY